MFRLSCKYFVCRSLNSDLWGNLRVKQTLNYTFIDFIKQYKQSRTPHNFFSRALVSRKFKRQTAFNQFRLARLKLLAFYSCSAPTRLNRKMFIPFYGFFYDILQYESRLSTVVYRANFTTSTIGSLGLLLGGYVTLNKEVVRNTDCLVLDGDVFELLDTLKVVKNTKILISLARTCIALLQPFYIELNYSTMLGVFTYIPPIGQLYYPFRVNILAS
jgi:hypothetical protein